MAILKENFFLSTHVMCIAKWFEQKHFKNDVLSPTIKMHVYCMSAKTIESIYQSLVDRKALKVGKLNNFDLFVEYFYYFSKYKQQRSILLKFFNILFL